MTGIWFSLMLSVVVFHKEGGSEVISVSYSFVFVLFFNLLVECMCTYTSTYDLY
jgi:hypothetical protein